VLLWERVATDVFRWVQDLGVPGGGRAQSRKVSSRVKGVKVLQAAQRRAKGEGKERGGGEGAVAHFG